MNVQQLVRNIETIKQNMQVFRQLRNHPTARLYFTYERESTSLATYLLRLPPELREDMEAILAEAIDAASDRLQGELDKLLAKADAIEELLRCN
jgi:hypothetical protein